MADYPQIALKSTELVPRRSGIYAIINLANQRSYVGGTQNIWRRAHDHKSALMNNRHTSPLMQEDFNQVGRDKFVIQILQLCDPLALCDREQHWHEKLRPEYSMRDVPRWRGKGLGKKTRAAA